MRRDHLGEQRFNLLRWGDGVGTGLERKPKRSGTDIFVTYCCIEKHTELLGLQQHQLCRSAGQSWLVGGCSYGVSHVATVGWPLGLGIQDGLVTCLVPLWGQWRLRWAGTLGWLGLSFSAKSQDHPTRSL